ncbi:hypothetical protein [Beijerinckia sp. L45]|uniref:hypothetical protein n=1 Tax=Beijerinckia sp. L45 TaxID=1641855 RepID=UPI00131D7F56|nr:hypothetical protein [Beijerinckia sp. L45]
MKLRNRVPLSVALVVMAFAAQAATSAARAQEHTDYKDIYGNLMSAVGFGKEHEPIDYSPRAPIAVPPSNDLPPPVEPGAKRHAAGFPDDPDVMARRKALVDPRQPVPPAESGQARNYLIEPPAAYFDASAVVATGNKADHGDATPVAKHHHHKKAEEAAAAQ